MRSRVLSGLLVLIMLLQTWTAPVYATGSSLEVEETTEVVEVEEAEEKVMEIETISEVESTEDENKSETEVETEIESSSAWVEETIEEDSKEVESMEEIESIHEETEVMTIEQTEITIEEQTSNEEILKNTDVLQVCSTSSNGLNNAVKNKILSLKSKYPEGKNWDPKGNGWRNLAWQCYGFVITMEELIFNKYPTNAHLRSTGNGKTVNGWTCYYVNSNNYNSLVVEPGDIIDCPTSSQWNHTAMVLSVDDGKITCVQANNGGNDYVYWTQCFNYNKSNSTLKSIYTKYSSYITGAKASKYMRLWKPSDELKSNATGYSLESTLKISGANYPTSINQGTGWSCKGTITSNYNISHVGAYILGSDHSTVIYSKAIKPNSMSYSLDAIAISEELLFNELPEGTYYYKITAHDESGKRLTLIDTEFTVIVSSLGIIRANYPESINSSTDWACEGTINSNCKITHIGGYILGEDHSTILYSVAAKPNSTSYSLKNSEVDQALLFDKLLEGTYYYKITAHDESGNRLTLIDKQFKVVESCDFWGQIYAPTHGGTDSTIVKINLKARDYHDISHFSIQVYGLGDIGSLEKVIVEPTSMETEDNTYIYDGSLDFDFPIGGAYEMIVDVVCNGGIVHSLGSKYIVYGVYNLSFITSEGADTIEIQYIEGIKTEIPEPDIREEYTFAGWYTEPEGKGTLFTNKIKVTSDLTLYAYWLENSSEEDHGDILPEDLPSDGIIPDGIWSEGITDTTYTGSNIMQSFRVYDGKKLLKEKTDYTISYKNNKNAYTYLDEDYTAFEEHLKNTGKRVKKGTFDPNKAPQVTIKMKGNYSGSQTIYFKINQADISGDAFEASDLTVTYSGKKQTPTPTLMWNGKNLKYGTDFYVPEYDAVKKDKNAFKDTGSYTVTITGKNNFMGELPITLTISNSVKQIAMNKVTVKGIVSQKWTGEQIVQSNYKVSYSKDVLTEENGDYTISWGANSDVGTGTVTFVGTGEDTDGDGYSYIGTKTVSFKITGTDMSKVTLTGVNKNYIYTGSAIEPAAVVTYQASKKAEPVALMEGTHYTVTYQKNTDKGTATIVVAGLASGGYTGTKKKTFSIVSSGIGDIKEGEAIVEQIEVSFKDTENVQDGVYVAPYMKDGAKPEIIVSSGDTTLVLNKDYTVSYANNKKVALSTVKNAPSITIKGKGNYSGSKKVYFTIAPKSLTNENGITIAANDKIVSTKKNGYKQSFKVYDSDGKALGSNDYDTKTVIYTLIETENADGTISMPNQVLDKNSIVPANSVIRITVQGKGNYAGGEAYGTYRILENSHDISKAVIQINNQAYTGNPVLITDQSQFKTGKVYIKIGKTTEVLTLGEDIEVVSDSYVKNINKGTAKVTFRGINEFGGTKTVSYKIGARSIGDFWKGIYTKVTNFFG